jgi:hypothetical protein
MLLELMEEFDVPSRAHADDRRHHARPADGAERRLRQRGRELRRARAGQLRRHFKPLHVAHSVRDLHDWLLANA